VPIDRKQVTTDMTVIDSEGAEAGVVKEIREEFFLLDRPAALDVYVPYTAIQNIAANTIRLNLSPRQIDDLSWADTPPSVTPT
jgi:hypothetical protein